MSQPAAIANSNTKSSLKSFVLISYGGFRYRSTHPTTTPRYGGFKTNLALPTLQPILRLFDNKLYGFIHIENNHAG